MVTRQYLALYRRYLVHRARAAATGRHVVFQGVVFTGKRVEFHARPAHGRLVLGPWCWIGNDNKLRAHEGQLTLGPKVVMGRDNVINTYLDIEVGDGVDPRRLDLHLRLRPPLRPARRADQGPGHRQVPGPDRR
jgi:acetyltransferase-like isoleucine patch superfamily enzyme